MKVSNLRTLGFMLLILLGGTLAFAQTTPSKKDSTSKADIKSAPVSSKKADDIINKGAPVIQKTDKGQINWTQQYIQAKGYSAMDTSRFKNKAQALLMGRRGAIVDAQRNLLETIKGVRVVGETKVQDMITTSDYVYTKVDGIVKGAEIVGEPVIKDGMVELTMRVPIYQDNGIAEVMQDAYNAQPENATKADTTQAPAPAPAEPKKVQSSRIAISIKDKITDPSLFPQIVDSKGQVLVDMVKEYDPTKGQFAKYVDLSEKTLKDLGLQKGVEIIESAKSLPGKFVLDEKNTEKFAKWKKAGKTLLEIGKYLTFLL